MNNIDPAKLNTETLTGFLSRSLENLNEANASKNGWGVKSNDQLFELQSMNAAAKPLFMEALSRSRNSRNERAAAAAAAVANNNASSGKHNVANMAALLAESAAGATAPAAEAVADNTPLDPEIVSFIASNISGSRSLNRDIKRAASSYGINEKKLRNALSLYFPNNNEVGSVNSLVSSGSASPASNASAGAPVAAAGAAPAVYFENQVGVLCAKHALNHVLKEEMFVWGASPARNFIGGDDPMLPTVKINLHKSCEDYEAGYKATLVEDELETQFINAMKYLTGERERPHEGSTSVHSVTGEIQKNYFNKKTDVLNVYELRKAQQGYDAAVTQYNLMAGFDPHRKQGPVPNANQTRLRENLLPDLIAYVDVAKDDRCQLERYGEMPGQLPIQVIPPLLRNLNMTFRLLYADGESTAHYDIGQQPPLVGTGRNILNLHAIMDTELLKPDCLGAVINIPGHYIAIVKHSGVCPAGLYSLIDSIYPVTKNQCLTLEELKTQLPPYRKIGVDRRERDIFDGRVKGIIFLYTNAASYVSQASRNRANPEEARARIAAPAEAAAAAIAPTFYFSQEDMDALKVYKSLDQATREILFAVSPDSRDKYEYAISMKLVGGRRRKTRGRKSARRNTRRKNYRR